MKITSPPTDKKVISPYRNNQPIERVAIKCPQARGAEQGEAHLQRTVCYVQVMQIGSPMFGLLFCHMGMASLPISNSPVFLKKKHFFC